jgi:DMSO/TMAO reductase YedYZ molybdopterin-dependent catalytic subunit
MTQSPREGETMNCNRRDFFRHVGLGTLGLGFGVSIFDTIFQYSEAATEAQKHDLYMKGSINFKGFVAKEVTPNEKFYITSYSSKVPDVSWDNFRLRIEGLVEKPYQLTMDELVGMKDKTEYVTLECIGNPVGGSAISNALWEGVTLRKVIEKALPKPGIVKAAFFAEEGYSDSIAYDLALSDDVFLAWRMNGEPLPKVHGYPLRAIVPGIYGMKNVKWLSKIELVNYDFKGFWEKEGWSDEAVIPVISEILMPMNDSTIPEGSYVIGGIAFGGRNGIRRVEISLDDGESWQEAELKPPLSKWAWTLWRYEWRPSKKGEYSLKVRGIDRSGKIQESGSLVGRLFGRTFPDGARGIQTIGVRITKP